MDQFGTDIYAYLEVEGLMACLEAWGELACSRELLKVRSK